MTFLIKLKSFLVFGFQVNRTLKIIKLIPLLGETGLPLSSHPTHEPTADPGQQLGTRLTFVLLVLTQDQSFPPLGHTSGTASSWTPAQVWWG